MTLYERLKFWLFCLTRFVPITGAEEEGGEGGEGEGGEGAGSGSGEGEGGDVEALQKELDKAKRRAAEAEKAKRKAEKAAKQAADAKAEEEGKFKELAEQRQKEAEEAKAELERVKREGKVMKVAKRLKFRDPDDAARFLSSDVGDEEADIERELKSVAEEKPYLLEEGGGGGRPAGSRRRERSKPDMDSLIRKRVRG